MSAFALSRKWVFAVGAALVLGFSAYYGFSAEKPSDAFERFLDQANNYCARYRQTAAHESICQLVKLKPADPLSTPEGRFAHSIKLPDPLKPDSGYRRGMTQDEYFDHLCKTEAGIFIYEKVKGVRGVLMMRPRQQDPYSSHHLYAPEGPFYLARDEVPFGVTKFVGPKSYEYLESITPLPISKGMGAGFDRSLIDSQNYGRVAGKVFRYSRYDKTSAKSLKVEVSETSSRYGFTWRGIVRPHDRELGIGGVEIIVLDVQTGRVLAFLRGYERFSVIEGMGVSGAQWVGRCPMPKKGAFYQDRDFLTEVLIPATTQAGGD